MTTGRNKHKYKHRHKHKHKRKDQNFSLFLPSNYADVRLFSLHVKSYASAYDLMLILVSLVKARPSFLLCSAYAYVRPFSLDVKSYASAYTCAYAYVACENQECVHLYEVVIAWIFQGRVKIKQTTKRNYNKKWKILNFRMD